ncbi:hypothetical protein G3A56_09225 [Rhizobium oryzihabitans]|uniref:Uncharacterized protein n=1 Tax=Rhizobium oryzihabitans TaxID=2267833 RepID=A0A7L5BH19_9HYPH|nr:hypothetical protein [Rhizobium oryzihabitans]QIB38148.1 hypothetical protein G3A56_09225 [Rhizobium oryzihabitans]
MKIDKKNKPTELEVIPHQNPVTVELWDGFISITEKGLMEGDVSISIAGKSNLDLLISGLQKARGMME